MVREQEKLIEKNREDPRVTRPPTFSASKRTVFRWVAALLIPIFLLLALELVLRLFGWGYPTHFFVRSGAGSPESYAENQKFGWRFFPRPLARAPNPLRL